MEVHPGWMRSRRPIFAVQVSLARNLPYIELTRGRCSDLGALLQSRRGRCGEFANLFSLFLHAASLQWRIVVNAEDHVWNEYWSASAERWVHLDPSEGSADQPLVYDLGWGKKQSYCIAFGPGGGRDVTRGYVSDWGEKGGCQERRVLWIEEDLNAVSSFDPG